MSWIGLDIGGANLKIADLSGHGISEPFALWQNPSKLEQALWELVSEMLLQQKAEGPHRFAITMTGELCDCFESKSDGVQHIVRTAERVLSRLSMIPPLYYSVDHSWHDAGSAQRNYLSVAAANWAAMGDFVAAKFSGIMDSGFLIDVGSTTTDIIPVTKAGHAAKGRTDTTRLENRELVYAGVGRTPICSLVDEFVLPSRNLPVARELFSTMKDALVLLGKSQVSEDDVQTADGRPVTLTACRQRLARSVCADQSELDENELLALATQAYVKLKSVIAASIKWVVDANSETDQHFLIAGEGDWLVREILNEQFAASKVSSIREVVSPLASKCGPAYAVAWLTAKELGDD